MSHQKSMRSGPANFQFVIHDPSQSPRQRELSASRARAHAARASFQPWYGQGARTVIEPARKRISRDSSAIPDQVNGKSIPSPAGPESGPSGEDARSDNESLLTHAADHHRYNPWQMSFGHRADPFTCLPGSNERVVILALDFFYSAMLDSFNTSGQAQQVVKVWSQYMLPLMSTFEPLFHVVMAIIFAGYDQTLRKRNATVSRQVYLQKHKAISKLRARLSQADAVPDDGVILTMLYLSLLDKGLGDSEARSIHQRQAMTMIEARGGPVSLNSEVFAAVLAQLTESSVDSTGVFLEGAALEEQNERSKSLNMVYRKMMGRSYATE